MYETKRPADVFSNLSSVIFFLLHVPTKDFSSHLHKNRTYPIKWIFEYLKPKTEKFYNSLQFQLKSFRDLVQV